MSSRLLAVIFLHSLRCTMSVASILFTQNSVHIFQNKILHSQLEALHIQWAEKERNAAGVSPGSSSADTFGDAGLQNVINYLRRSKEIVNSFVLLIFSLISIFMFNLLVT